FFTAPPTPAIYTLSLHDALPISVQFFYHKPFFCRTPVEDGNAVGSTTACEVGSDGTVDPRLGSIPILFVMTPIGFRPAESTLQCPVVGHCINHPSTIDLSRVVVAAISSMTAARSMSGRPRQFCVMRQNRRCSILFHFDVPGG